MLRIGVTDGTDALEVQDLFTIPLDDLRAAWRAPLRAAFASTAE